MIDQEHGPFDRTSSDIALMAARATDTPALVRVPGRRPFSRCWIAAPPASWSPMSKSAAYAREVAAMLRYRGGSRGFATSTRAGRYSGIPMWRHIADLDARMVFVAQIEDPVGAGRDRCHRCRRRRRLAVYRRAGDLTAAFGDESKDPPDVLRAVERISEAARKANKPISVYVGNATEAAWLNSLGANVFVLSSDQGFAPGGDARACAMSGTRSDEHALDRSICNQRSS